MQKQIALNTRQVSVEAISREPKMHWQLVKILQITRNEPIQNESILPLLRSIGLDSEEQRQPDFCVWSQYSEDSGTPIFTEIFINFSARTYSIDRKNIPPRPRHLAFFDKLIARSLTTINTPFPNC